jgi:GNAT superfamily N-acetyltransferase
VDVIAGNPPVPYTSIEKIGVEHDTGPFDCGQSELNQFLKRFALVNQKAGAATTYVVCRGNAVIGYYSLAVGSVEYDRAPEGITKGIAHHPVPLMILARLAVDSTEHGKGLGKGLLKDAILRTLKAAEIAGIRAIVVHAKDDEARRFYEHFNFRPSPTDQYHLFCLMKDVKKLLP